MADDSYAYWNPESLLAISVILSVLGIVAVGLRLYARRVQQVSYKWDDWFSVIALAMQIFMSITVIYAVKNYGYGTSPPNAGDPTVDSGLGPPRFVIQLLQVLVFSSIKFAALFFYQRVFCPNRHFMDAFRVTVYALITLLAMWSLAFTVFTCTRCGNDFAALWHDKLRFIEHCVQLDLPYQLAFSISDFLFDLIIIVLPIPKVFSLHMNLPRKLAITFVFLTASVGLAASIARMVNVIYTVTDATKASADPKLENNQLIFWSLLEGGLGLIAVNLPAIWSLKGGLSLERTLRSVRSIMSLRSSPSSKQHSRVDNNRTSKAIESDVHVYNLDDTLTDQRQPSSAASESSKHKTLRDLYERQDVELRRSMP